MSFKFIFLKFLVLFNELFLDFTNLVVEDSSRTEKIVCLAVSPSLKQVIILVDTTEIPIIDVVEIETYTSAN